MNGTFARVLFVQATNAKRSLPAALDIFQNKGNMEWCVAFTELKLVNLYCWRFWDAFNILEVLNVRLNRRFQRLIQHQNCEQILETFY